MNEDTDDTAPNSKPPKRRERSLGLAGIAVVIAIVALAMAAWSTWRLQHAMRADDAARKQETAAIAALASRLASSDQQAQTGAKQMGTLESGLDDLRSATQGLNRRLANLETAYTNLSGQQQTGRDTLLLNDAEMLLRTGQQRYELFHDGAGALKAYSQAIEVLAQVQNPAYAPVRASAITERDALAATAPPSRQTALDTLSTLRGKVASMPLATAASAAPSSAKPGFWSRVGNAFSGVVRVSRENGRASPLADPRFARQSLGLDLAQAQESLLAFDSADFHAALQRADAVLVSQFDDADAEVKNARVQIDALLAQRATGPAPQLGGALAQLQSLRASQPAAPAPATSSGATKP